MDQSPVVLVVQEFSASLRNASRSLSAKPILLSSVDNSFEYWNELGRALSPLPSSSLPKNIYIIVRVLKNQNFIKLRQLTSVTKNKLVQGGIAIK